MHLSNANHWPRWKEQVQEKQSRYVGNKQNASGCFSFDLCEPLVSKSN